jgi:hypothetical protein
MNIGYNTPRRGCRRHLSPDLSPQGRGDVERLKGCELVIPQGGQKLKEGGWYTYNCRYPESLPPSLVGRGRGRGKIAPSRPAAGIRLPLPLWRGGRGCVINYEL